MKFNTRYIDEKIPALGNLEEIKDLREVWPHEANSFTPWLSKNIECLGRALGIDIEVEETESSVGDFAVDILHVMQIQEEE